MRTPAGLYIDHPSWPLVQAHISYWGITSAAGNALGTTLVCADLANEPNYAGLAIKVLDGGAAGQVRPIASHIGNTITVAAAFTNAAGVAQQIVASTRFVILSAGGGGGAPPPAPPAPGVGLWMFGVCEPGMVASFNTLVLTNLAGFNDDIFNNEFWIQVIHNADIPGTAPEREIRRILDYVGATGTFTTDPFSANVEANDLVCLFHESIMAIEIMGYGTLDFSSATVPADSARTLAYPWENNDYFAGCLLIPTEGACRLQPRRIINYTAATGVFTIDPNYPFSAATGLVDYVIVGDQCGYLWPYVQALMDVLESPQVDQNDIEVARLSIHNLRPDDAVIPVGEYAGTVINIDRYRPGVDVAWNNIVAGVALTEAAGYSFYTYTFPNASWQDGDLVRYRISGCVLTIPAGAVGANFYVPEQIKTAVVGGIAAIIKKLDLVFDIVNAILTLKETGGTLTADGTEQVLVQVEAPLGVFKPTKVKLDCSNMDWGDSTVIRWYERIAGGGGYVQKDELQLDDIQVVPLKNIELEPNRHGVRATLQQIAGTNRDYNWEYLFES